MPIEQLMSYLESRKVPRYWGCKIAQAWKSFIFSKQASESGYMTSIAKPLLESKERGFGFRLDIR